MSEFLKTVRSIFSGNRRQLSRRSVRGHVSSFRSEHLEDRTLLAANLLKDINTTPTTSGSSPAGIVDVGGVTYFSANVEGYGEELWKSDGTAAGTVLVRDIRTGSVGSSLRYLTNVNGTLYFRATDGVNGDELWKSDGTTAGTVLVKDIYTGAGSASPRYLTNVNGTLYFRATDGVNGYELWKSDGTTAGTVLVKDIRTGTSNSTPRYLTNVNGTLYFIANDGVNGDELWKSDGTTAGTVLVKDILTGTSSSLPRELTNVNGTLYFSAYDSVNGDELWKSDGTTAGTVLVSDIRTGINSSDPGYLTNVNGTLYFRATNDFALWKSDGTTAGTVLVKTAGGGFVPTYLTNVNGTLYFNVYDGMNGIELWKSDGTTAGTVLVKDIRPGSGNSNPRYLTNVNGTLYFRATDGVNGDELWKSDGTAAGTVLVKDIRTGTGSSSPLNLTNVNGTLYFRATDGVNGYELWKSDGTAAGTVLVKDILTGTSSSIPRYLTNVNGTVYFRATDGVTGYELWKSNGTAAGTVLVKDIRTGTSGSSPNLLTNVNGTLYFRASDGVNGDELWKSDGTTAGTVLVKDIRTGTSRSLPRELTNVNGTLYFSATDGVNGYELWKSDGTTAGTVLVKDILTGTSSSIPRDLTNVNGTLYFRATDGVNGYELWKSDGTAAGTVLVKDIATGTSSSTPLSLRNVNGTLYFIATDGVNGSELWKSDGTAAGTVLVKDIFTGAGSASPRYLTNVNGTLYFRANDGVNGDELWKSDGTTAGTVLVQDIRTGGGSASPRNLTNVNGTLYFSAYDSVNGDELWKSDGTTAGTVLVSDIRTGINSSDPGYLTNVNGTLYFIANDGVSDFELWKSDGTTAGTVLVNDIIPGSGGSSPNVLTAVGEKLFFAAWVPSIGRELWIVEYEAPVDIELTGDSIAENQPVGTAVGTLSTTDSIGDTHTYALVSGAGDVDNASFEIVGNQLRTKVVFDFETKPSYTVRVRTTDQGQLAFEKVFTISVSDQDETPPTVTMTNFLSTGTLAVNSTSLSVTFSEPVVGANLPASYALRLAGTDGLLGNADDPFVNISSVTMTGNTAALNFPALTEDVYRLSIKDTITDVAGDRLDGDANGLATGNWNRDFVVTPGNSGLQFNGMSFPSGGSAPLGMAAGDFNGDGRDDLAAVNANSNNVAILMNNGTGGFNGPTTFPSNGTGPRAVVVGDFNKDSRLDLGVSNRGSSSISIFLGLGNGSFNFLTSFGSGGVNPDLFGMAIADFNGDTQLDLVATNITSNNVVVFFGTGSGMFSSPSPLPDSGSLNPIGVTVGDFNNDNNKDVVVTFNGSNQVRLYLGDGNGSFALGNSISSNGSSPISVVAGDWNGDGNDDIAVTNRDSNNIGIFLGNGAGVLTAMSSLLSGGSLPYGLVQGDFDLDGRTDLAVANSGGGDVVIHPGSGSGAFSSAGAFSPNGSEPYQLVVGSFNGDGFPDLAVTNGNSGSVGILASTTTVGVRPFFTAGGSNIDLQVTNPGSGQIVQGPNNAFDGLNRLQVGSNSYAPNAASLVLSDSNQTLVTPTVAMYGVTVSREVMVPMTGSQDFARTLDILTNSTGASITLPVRIVGNLGSDAATTVFATSDGDLLVEPTDLWFGTDDADGTGTPAIIHLLHGPYGLQPASVNVIEDNVEWTYDLTVPAGETKRLAHFTVLGTTQAEAIAAANALVMTSGFGGEAAAFLTTDELASLANFQFNSAPTNIAITNGSIAENSGVNAIVGSLTFTDPDPGETGTFSLPAGLGDNALFNIAPDGITLRANGDFDFESQNSYSITIRATDAGGLLFDKQFTINVTDVNEAPIDVSLTSTTVAENQPGGTVVGTLTTIDSDAANTFTYSLVEVAGDSDHQQFTIFGNQLRTTSTFDFETKSSYTVCVRTTDQGQLSFEKVLTINVTDVADSPPSSLSLSYTNVSSDALPGTSIGTFASLDPDPGSSFSLSLVSGTGDNDNSKFQIIGNVLLTNSAFDYRLQNTFSIRVRTTDQTGLSFEDSFNITLVRNVATVVEDLIPGGGINNSDSSNPLSVIEVSGTAYFVASDGIHGSELWRINSSGVAEMVEDAVAGGGINTGVNGSNPSSLTNVNGTLYFRANDGVNGDELWRINSSGVAEMVEDALSLEEGSTPVSNSSSPIPLTDVNGMLYFRANDGVNGDELWRINSSGVAEMVEDALIAEGGINPGSNSSNPSSLTHVNGMLYFRANDGVNGDELWRINSSGLAEIVEDSVVGGGINPGSNNSNPGYLTNVNGTLYFRASDGVKGNELWRINSSGLAEIVEDSVVGGGINPGNASSSPGSLTNVSGTLYFRASDGVNGEELWRTNSSGLAEMVEDAVDGGGIRPGIASSSLESLTNVSGTLYFRANDGVNGHELWRINSSGVAEIVEDAVVGGGINPGSNGSNPIFLRDVNGTLYFNANDGVNGQELWRINSSGFAEIVEDSVVGGGINAGSNSSGPGSLTNANGTLYFRANDGVNGYELWRINSSGIAEMVEDALAGGGINSGGGSSNPSQMTAIGNKLYFVANDGFVNGNELWVLSVNEAPTDISLSSQTLAENAGSDAVLGTLSFTDSDPGDTGTFSLPAGFGDNALFNIAPDGTTLRANGDFDFETQNSYSITVRVTDAGGLSFDKQFTISVTDVNESPVGLDFVYHADPFVPENTSTVSRIKFVDILVFDDALGTNTLSLEGEDAESFEIVDAQLFLKAGVNLDFETKPFFFVNVLVHDAEFGPSSATGSFFFLEVTDVNEAPIANAGQSQSSDEGESVLFDGSMSSDVDSGDLLSFHWDFGDGVTGTGAQASHVFADNGVYTVMLRVTDLSGAISEDSLTVTVANVAPTAGIIPIGTPKLEGTAISVTGTSIDPAAANDTLTFAWSVYKDGAVTSFATGGNSTAFTFTPNDNGSYRIVLTVSDEDGGATSVESTIAVDNVAPTATLQNNSGVIYGNSAIATFVAPFDPSLTDTTAGFRYAFSLDTNTTGSATYETASSANSFDFGVINAGHYVLYARIIDKDGGFTAYNRDLVVDKATATITANNKSKTYGDMNPVLDAVISGTVNGDVLDYSLSTLATQFSNVGSYGIMVGLGANPNYSVTPTDSTLTIGQKSATVLANNKSKTYGDENPALDAAITGTVNGDVLAYSLSTLATQFSNVDSYGIVVTLGTNPNYSITPTDGTLTIGQKSATVSANNKSKTYGDVNPDLDAAITGTVNGDVLAYSLSTLAIQFSNVDSYGIVVTLGTNPNYSVTPTGGTLTIGQKSATVSANNKSKTYGDVNPALDAAITGTVNGDVLAYSLSTLATQFSNVDSYGIIVGLGANPNYSVTPTDGTLAIGQRSASVTSASGQTKVYGSADPILVGSLSGFLNDDGVTATYSRAAGETVLGGPYTISATLSPSDVLANYDITYNTASFAITTKSASVTPASGQTKVYGAADPILVGSLSGFLNDDGVTATYNRAAGETVLGGPYTISATLSPSDVLSNYDITYNTASFVIFAKSASVTPASGQTKVYGSVDPILVGTLGGFLNADGVTATYSRAAGETVLGGPYDISATLSPSDVLSNYDVTYNTASFAITTKSASVTPASGQTKVYGSADPVLLGTLSGFLNADGVTATYSRAAGETVLGGPYVISATLSPSDVLSNYDVTYNTASFAITTKSASVTPASGQTKVYGSADPILVGTLSGFLNVDGVTATYSRAAGETVLGGPYSISATLSPSDVLSNYDITYNTASFAITAKSASVTPAAGQTKVYGSADPILVGTLSGFLNADGVTATYSRAVGETVLGGPYDISATLSSSDVLSNYDITYNTASFVITAKSASVTPASGQTRVYGSADPILVGTLSGFLTGDNVTATYSRAAGETVLGGPYVISATLSPSDVLSNYDITYNAAGFVITTASTTLNLASSTNISVSGQYVTFTATVASPTGGPPVGSITFSNGSTVLGTVPLAGGVAIISVPFSSLGTHVITATYTPSSDFAASGPVSVNQSVETTALLPGTVSGEWVLYVGGTNGDDKIHVHVKNPKNGADQSLVHIKTKGVSGEFNTGWVSAPTGGSIVKVVAYGLDGDDDISVHDQKPGVSAWLFGGKGNDELKAGDGTAILVGGDGCDELEGGKGRSVLIGGNGADELEAGKGNSVLIGGSTIYDTPTPGNLAALDAVLAELTVGGSQLSSLLNSSTIDDDGNADELKGGGGIDWFFGNVFQDSIKKRKSGDLFINTAGW
jgi:ELWxxDGT repeat protein